MSRKTRPLKLKDANFESITESETYLAFRGDYTGTSLTYAGFARAGADTGEEVWQIRFLQYDGSGNLTSITWPQKTTGEASSDFEFEWDNRAAYTYS